MSDFSAIHRIDDIGAMPSRRFFILAERIMAYPGVMNVLAKSEARKHAEEKDLVPSTREGLTEAGLEELFDFA